MPIKKKINFKRTHYKDFESAEKEFKTEQDFDKWLDEQYQDESYRKIVGIEDIK